MPVVFLTDEQVAILQEVVKDYQGRRQNAPTRSQDEYDHLAPEVYLALAPDVGIPALDRLGTGSVAEDDIPGSAVCEIYKLVGTKLKPAGFSKMVYNLTEQVVDSAWLLIQRDKYGTWFVKPGVTNVACNEDGDLILTY